MHTNSTPNYGLPQFVSGDSPTWLGDVNGAMLAIDTAVAGVATKADSADAKADLATTAAQTASGVATGAASAAASASADAASAITTAGNAATAAQSASTAAQSAQSTADGAATAAATAQSTAEGAATAAGAVDTKVGSLSDLDTTDKSSIVNAINEVAADIGGGSISVTGDGVKTFGQLLTELFALVDPTKIKRNSTLDHANGVFHLITYSPSSYVFTRIRMSVTDGSLITYAYTVSASGAYTNATIDSNGISVTDQSSIVITNGQSITIYY